MGGWRGDGHSKEGSLNDFNIYAMSSDFMWFHLQILLK